VSTVKLSLVFCCYNVSEYLDDIYNWILNQSYSNIEVIFVEDSSTDNTKEKLYDLFIDPRMRIIENEHNLGLSESRNVGLRNASGEYIGFPDPDDMFALNWLQEIATAINSYSPEVIITGMREDYENGEKLEFSKDIISKYSGYIQSEFDSVLVDLEQTMLFGYMNNKFYNRELLLANNITCKKMALKEDFDFNINVFNLVENYYILNKPYYFYKKRRNGNTLTAKFVSEYFSIHENSVFLLKELLESKAPLSAQSKKLLVNRFFRYLLSAIERNTNVKSNLSLAQQVNWVKEILLDKKYNWFFERKHDLTGKFIFIKPFLKQNLVFVLVIIGYILNITKGKLPVVFAKIKS